MDTINKRRLAAAFVVAAGSLGTGVALAGGGSARSSGPDRLYANSQAFAHATARVHVVHTGNEGTHVTLHIVGVDAPAGQTFGAHVHQSRCGATGAAAGPHYHGSTVGPLEDREIWLDFTVNADGIGHAEASRPWSLDETTQHSVIIHALPTNPLTGLAGARLACIDLDGHP